jgi:LuxR family maltose regulon positive regulatory protein
VTIATESEFTAARAPGALPFAHVPAKVLVPTPRPGSIWRTPVINRLRGAQSFPVVTILGPPGSGKTTILAQWADRDERPFAWVSIDDRDNDPLILARHIAVALHRIAPLDRAVLNALRSRARSLWTTAIPNLAMALTSRESPCVMVLDNASLLSSNSSLEVASTLAEHIGRRSNLVLSGRTPFEGSIAAIRARGLLFELGPDLLSLSKREAESLLRATAIELDDHQVSELIDRNEGWAAGLYLSALAVRDGSSPDCERLSGDDRYLADYFRSECLAGHSPQQLAFLRRTSILESLSAPLCNAVLGRRDSARELAAIGASNLFAIPLEQSGRSYRYHRLFRDLLRRELEREEPERVLPMHRLAADWFEANDEGEAVITHAAAAGDMDRVARLVVSLGAQACAADGIATVERWLHFFDRPRLERHREVAVLGAWVHARRGRALEAKEWLAIAEGSAPEDLLVDGTASLQACVAIVRAAMCEDGVEKMLSDTEIALAKLPPESCWRPIAVLLRGVALALLGESDEADAAFACAAEIGELRGATDACVAALSQRALIAADCGDHAAVDRFTHDARRIASTAEADCLTAGVLQPAEFARTLLRGCRWREVREELMVAHRLLPSLPSTFPWLVVQTHLELARAFLTLRDAGAAQSELDLAGAILGREINLGILHVQAVRLRHQVDQLRESRASGDFGLTPAELRLIPLLASHLSFRMIAERFLVSRNTVKTQAISVYRKLGVSNRSDAIEEASRLGLIDGNIGAVADDAEADGDHTLVA